MAKNTHAVNEAQLKARRTSLDKKEHDELINIILRKDSTERKNNAKIQELTTLLKEADELNEEKATRILEFEKDIADMKDTIYVKQEQIDSIYSETSNIRNEYDSCYKKVIYLTKLCNIRKRIILACFGIITALIVVLIVLGF